jgi:FkbM family methyltransferase
MGTVRLLNLVLNHPLNRPARFAALSRFARWQIAARLMPTKMALPYVERTFLFASKGMTAATANWYFGLYEQAEMGFALHLLRPGDLFVDVGANIGSFTVLAAGAVGARTLSAEPLPRTFRDLQDNIVLNGIAALASAHRVGISDKAGTLRFRSDLDGQLAHVMAEGETGESEEVPVTTLDAFCEGEAPRLLKIDVEGHELAVLKGGGRVLADPALDAVIMETNGSGDRYGIPDEALFEAVEAHGFAAHRYDPFARSLTRTDAIEANSIFVRDAAAVEARCRAAPRFKLCNGSI